MADVPTPAAHASADEFDTILAPAGSADRTAQLPRSNAAPITPGAAHGIHVAAEPRDAANLTAFVDNWELYRDPVLSGMLAGAALGALGVFVLLRRAVFLTAALSQAAGLGVALAFFAEIHLSLPLSPVLGALTSSALVTILVGVRAPPRVSREAMVGFVFVFASAAAVLVGDSIAQEAHDVAAILFGTAVLVRPIDLWLLAFGAIASLAALLALSRPLTFTGIDPDGARVQGLPVRAIEIGFWALFALEVSLATRALGALPVFAFAVLPAAAGLLSADRIPTAILISTVAGAASGGLGYLLAFLKELPVGAAQAATAALLAVIAFVVARAR